MQNCLFIYLFAYLINGIIGKYYSIDSKNNIKLISEFEFLIGNVDDQIAIASYNDSKLNLTGWNFLNIKTSSKFSNQDQFSKAGFLEGYLTQKEIFNAYRNAISTIFNGNSTLPTNLLNYVKAQSSWIESQIKKNNHSNYWELAGGIYNQLKSMYQGYSEKVQLLNKTEEKLDFDHFYILTNMGDLEDLIPVFQNKLKTVGECSGFTKLINGTKFLTGHSTFNDYQLMLRIFKIYEFSINNNDIVATKMSFSSRPGDLESKDDYYVLNSNLVVLETSLLNFNKSMYKTLRNQTVPSWLRVSIANRLASDPKSWASYFGLYNSGTHNAQWIITNYNNPKNKSDLVWMVEQFFNLYKTFNANESLLFKNGYVASYNIPFSKQIYEYGEFKKNVGKNYSNDPRAILFKKYAPSINTAENLKYYLRIANKSKYCGGMAPRCDLSTKNPYGFGEIDSKIIDSELLKNNYTWIISGPTTDDNIPPFSFTGKFENLSHYGMPQTYNFTWVYHSLTNNISNAGKIKNLFKNNFINK